MSGVSDEIEHTSHRAEIRFWGDPNHEQYVVLCHAEGCGWRSRGGLGAEEAGRAQMAHWQNPGGPSDGR